MIRLNIAALRLEDRARFLYMQDTQAIAQLAREKAVFDLIFLDPPYRLDTAPACKALHEAGVLLPDALVVIEHAAAAIPSPEACFELTDQRKYRDTMISFYRYRRD